MKVAELIELLKAMPQDAVVGYVNECADDGCTFIEADAPEFQTFNPDYWRRGHCDDLPKAGAVLL